MSKKQGDQGEGYHEVFAEQTTTTTLIDRLVHHSHLLIFDGESHRVKTSLMRQ